MPQFLLRFICLCNEPFPKFFQHIDILPENVHILDGNAANLQAECDQYEASIKAAGGVHLFIGGKITRK